MFFRRRHSRRLAEESARISRQANSKPWLEHGLKDGEIVPCRTCGRRRSVRLVKQTQVVIAVASDTAQNILVCTGCGRLLCQDCAHAVSSMRPECDDCGTNMVFPMT